MKPSVGHHLSKDPLSVLCDRQRAAHPQSPNKPHNQCKLKRRIVGDSHLGLAAQLCN
jgi:hypothetical protein